jgi:hypothetical protein
MPQRRPCLNPTENAGANRALDSGGTRFYNQASGGLDAVNMARINALYPVVPGYGAPERG